MERNKIGDVLSQELCPRKNMSRQLPVFLSLASARMGFLITLIHSCWSCTTRPNLSASSAVYRNTKISKHRTQPMEDSLKAAVSPWYRGLAPRRLDDLFGFPVIGTAWLLLCSDVWGIYYWITYHVFIEINKSSTDTFLKISWPRSTPVCTQLAAEPLHGLIEAVLDQMLVCIKIWFHIWICSMCLYEPSKSSDSKFAVLLSPCAHLYSVLHHSSMVRIVWVMAKLPQEVGNKAPGRRRSAKIPNDPRPRTVQERLSLPGDVSPKGMITMITNNLQNMAEISAAFTIELTFRIFGTSNGKLKKYKRREMNQHSMKISESVFSVWNRICLFRSRSKAWSFRFLEADSKEVTQQMV